MKTQEFDYKIYKEADRRHLLVQVAKMYYYDSLSQHDIAARIHVSRSNVSKMLQACKEMGIVEIHINEVTSRGLEIEHELKSRFALNHVRITPHFSDAEELKTHLGKTAARYLNTILRMGMTIGISGGTTLRCVVDQIESTDPPRVDVVQLMGGVGARDISIDGVQLAYALAAKLSGRCTVIHAPLYVQNREVKKILLREPEIAASIESGAKSDVALIGIGSSTSDSNALIRAGFLTKSETKAIQEQGAVGNILGRQLDRDGNICSQETNDRVIGIEIEQFRTIPVRIGVAGGSDKAEAILSTLRKGYINVLITDESAALQILQKTDVK